MSTNVPKQPTTPPMPEKVKTHKCVFCESYKIIKEIYEEHKNPNISYVYKVALLIHTKKKGFRAYRGRTTDYNTRGIGYKLNYCPECGRKLGGKA